MGKESKNKFGKEGKAEPEGEVYEGNQTAKGSGKKRKSNNDLTYSVLIFLIALTYFGLAIVTAIKGRELLSFILFSVSIIKIYCFSYFFNDYLRSLKNEKA